MCVWLGDDDDDDDDADSGPPMAADRMSRV
jgi:hypothetical protein